MQKHRATHEIGNAICQNKFFICFGFLIFSLILCPPTLFAKEVTINASVDQNSISRDDSVTLKIIVRMEGGGQIEDPTFVAPDFTLINEYNGSSTESLFINGRFTVNHVWQINKILKPLKTGLLKISQITVRAAGQSYKAPDLSVDVLASGAGTPPPRNYGGAGMGLRGSAKRTHTPDVLIRAEVNKNSAFKGEQIIVSYYLFTRVRIFNMQTDRYPALKGFLREELEMPLLKQSGLQSERVILDGVAYERSLLFRYGAYPLEEGKLTIDSLNLKYNYYQRPGDAFDDEDPFMQFFQQMAPRTGTLRSEPLTIEAKPLPEAGRPSNFTGGVGDFSVTSLTNKTDARTNEALQLTVKVEGRGNVSAITEPKTQWPDSVEMYEAKSYSKTSTAGVGEKIFEFLLIPRKPGPLQLPAIEFSFFDPQKKEYYSRNAPGITLQVSGEALPPAQRPHSSTASESTQTVKSEDIEYLKTPIHSDIHFQGFPFWRWLYWGAILSFSIFMLVVFMDLLDRGKSKAQHLLYSRAKAHERSWNKLKDLAQSAQQSLSWNETLQAYELLCSLIFEALEKNFPIGVKAISRSELRNILVQEKNLDPQLWERFSRLLEFAETVRYATSVGAVTEAQARQELLRHTEEARALVKHLDSKGTP